MFNNNNSEQLETARLILRPLSVTDEREIFFLRSDTAVNKYIGRPLAKTIEDARAFIEKIIAGYASGNTWYWAITEKDEDVLIGTACIWNVDDQSLSAEIGYELLPRSQGRGYMKEVLEKMISYAFTEMKLQKLYAGMDPLNERSAGLVLKCGFRFDGEREGESVYVLDNNKRESASL